MVPQGYWQDGKYILIDGALEKKDAEICRLKKENAALRKIMEMHRQLVIKIPDF
jgi:hypothetical protein